MDYASLGMRIAATEMRLYSRDTIQALAAALVPATAGFGAHLSSLSFWVALVPLLAATRAS
jgi:hypothetical protein